MARYAPAHVEASVAELAVHASVPQLRRSLSRYSFDPPAENGHTQQHNTRETKESDEAADGDAVSRTGDAVSGTGDEVSIDGEVLSSDALAAHALAGIPPTWNGLALVQDRASAPAELSMSHDQWGRFTLRFSAPADLGALVQAALTEAKDALFSAGQP